MLRELEQGVTVPQGIVADSRLVGRVTLSNIVCGPFHSCNVGYWVSADANGQGGVATNRKSPALLAATARVVAELAIAFVATQSLGIAALRDSMVAEAVASRRGGPSQSSRARRHQVRIGIRRSMATERADRARDSRLSVSRKYAMTRVFRLLDHSGAGAQLLLGRGEGSRLQIRV